MYEPDINDLTVWAEAVLQYAAALASGSTPAPPAELGIWGKRLAQWMLQEFSPIYQESVHQIDSEAELTALRSMSEDTIWDAEQDAERKDMFQSENVFNFGDYIWVVPILNADEPIIIFEDSLLLDTIAKVVFLAVARGILSDEETNTVSRYLTADLEARGQSRRSFDDRKGYDSFRLLLFFYYHGDISQRTGEMPMEWLTAAWRDLDEVRAFSFKTTV